MGVEVPVRATTAALFFFAAAIALYFSTEQPALLPLAKGSVLFFAALGPTRWVEEMFLQFPVRLDHWRRAETGERGTDLVRIGGMLSAARYVELLFGAVRIVVLATGLGYAIRGVWQLA